jgi:hypothetical protein
MEKTKSPQRLTESAFKPSSFSICSSSVATESPRSSPQFCNTVSHQMTFVNHLSPLSLRRRSAGCMGWRRSRSIESANLARATFDPRFVGRRSRYARRECRPTAIDQSHQMTYCKVRTMLARWGRHRIEQRGVSNAMNTLRGNAAGSAIQNVRRFSCLPATSSLGRTVDALSRAIASTCLDHTGLRTV